MKRTYGITIAAAMAAFAFQGVGSASITACPTMTTYNNYIGISCQTGNVVFTGFEFSSLTLKPGDIVIQPLSDGGFYLPNPISVSANADGSPRTIGFSIGYNATAVPGTTLGTYGIEFNASASHGGNVTLTTMYCINSSLAFCPQGQNGLIFLNQPTGPFEKSLTLPPNTTKLGIRNELVLNSGIGGTAQQSQFETSLSQTPETSTNVMAALGVGGFGILLFRKRRKRGTAAAMAQPR